MKCLLDISTRSIPLSVAQLLFYITFAVGIRHGDDVLLIPAEKMEPGFAIQDGRQRVTCKIERRQLSAVAQTS